MSAVLKIKSKNVWYENEDELELLKLTICKGLLENEFRMFVVVAKNMGLNPFMKQIYPVKRPSYNLKTKNNDWVMTIQTGIDGYRLIADRTGRYSPGKAPTYTYDDKGNLNSATVYVKKLTSDGSWHEVSSDAFYSEYVCLKKDGTPNSMWSTKGHIMLSKCAESLALRKAFPSELSGIYTDEEMQQADNIENFDAISNDLIEDEKKESTNLSSEQIKELTFLTRQITEERYTDFLKYYGIKTIHEMKKEKFNEVIYFLKKIIDTKESENENN
jgi:phage recombination protein Bet